MVISAGKALALVRIGFGLYYLSYGWDKLSKGWLTESGPLTNFLFGNPAAQPPTRGAAAAAEPFFRSFLEAVVQPNVLLFSQLITIGELAAAILLTLGLLTRLGALVGILLNLNYMLLKGMASNGGSIDRLFLISDLVFLLAAAGMVWGLDGLLQRSLGSNTLARWLSGPGRGERLERIAAR
ncbi:MAG: DoxX family membrane protein [Chloroflexi bacterium]|nr:DoxX family membrane protein [Chloroflexota bacterium]